MATSHYREWAAKVPYLDSLLTLYTAYTVDKAIRDNYSQDPGYMDILKNNDVMSILALFWWTTPFMALLAVVQLYWSLRILRVATQKGSERAPQSASSLCGTWCKICMLVLFEELLIIILLGSYFKAIVTLTARVMLIALVRNWMDELKVEFMKSQCNNKKMRRTGRHTRYNRNNA